jgi:hypothetical protein
MGAQTGLDAVECRTISFPIATDLSQLLLALYRNSVPTSQETLRTNGKVQSVETYYRNNRCLILEIDTNTQIYYERVRLTKGVVGRLSASPDRKGIAASIAEPTTKNNPADKGQQQFERSEADIRSSWRTISVIRQKRNCCESRGTCN